MQTSPTAQAANGPQTSGPSPDSSGCEAPEIVAHLAAGEQLPGCALYMEHQL